MANNYSQATLTPFVHLTDELRALLELTGAGFEDADEGNDKEYVFWEENFDEDLAQCFENNDMTPENYDYSDGEWEQIVEKWSSRSFTDLLRAILKENPDVDLLIVEVAFTCSKLRPGEFGGMGIYVTRDQYGEIGSNGIALKNGKLVASSIISDFATPFAEA